LALTACAGSSGSGKTSPPVLGSIPAKLKQPCARPVELSAGKKSQKQVEALWGKDRANLVKCADGKQGLVKFVEDRDRRIGGDK
jgi:hypothetical protein